MPDTVLSRWRNVSSRNSFRTPGHSHLRECEDQHLSMRCPFAAISFASQKEELQNYYCFLVMYHSVAKQYVCRDPAQQQQLSSPAWRIFDFLIACGGEAWMSFIHGTKHILVLDALQRRILTWYKFEISNGNNETLMVWTCTAMLISYEKNKMVNFIYRKYLISIHFFQIKHFR